MKLRIFFVVALSILFLFVFLSCEKDPTSSKDETLKDIDGNVYQIVKIGEQWWMAENLKVTHYRNGDPIQKITDNTEWTTLTTGAYCNYGNDDSLADTCGSLYNWYAVSDNRNIAPEGWHVPSDDEWKELEMHLGMIQLVADSAGLRGTDEGSKLKSTSHWSRSGNGNDDFGFSVLPSGYRLSNYGFFEGMGYYTHIWSSTDYDGDHAWDRGLAYSYSAIGRGYYTKTYGFSVRLVRD